MTGVTWKLHTGFYISRIFFSWGKNIRRCWLYFIKSFLVKSTERPSLPQRQAWENLRSVSKRKISVSLESMWFLKVKKRYLGLSISTINWHVSNGTDLSHHTKFSINKKHMCYNFPCWQVYFYFVAAINKPLWVEEELISVQLNFILFWNEVTLILENYMLARTSIFYFC